MSYKSGSAFPTTFEFVVRKQDHLPLVRVIDYAYQAPIDSILGGPLFTSPEPEIKQEKEPFYLPLVIKKEEESVLLPRSPTLVQGFIDLVYPQVPPFPHVEDYLWPDFSDDADTFFEQFEEPEELASYRSKSPRLPPVLRFNTPVDQRRIEFFQGWEFEEEDVRYAPPLLEPVLPPQIWQELLPILPRFPPVDLKDPGYHMLRSLYFAPILFVIPGDRTPNLTTMTVTTNHYTPYPIQCPWPRLSHSLMTVHLMFTSYQILHHAYRTALHLGASCISSPLYDPYPASCSSHVSLMTRTHPIGYDPLI